MVDLKNFKDRKEFISFIITDENSVFQRISEKYFHWEIYNPKILDSEYVLAIFHKRIYTSGWVNSHLMDVVESPFTLMTNGEIYVCHLDDEVVARLNDVIMLYDLGDHS